MADFAAPWPRDWTLAADRSSVFTHAPSGARIALPVAGHWVGNPGDPQILACDDMHIELRNGRRF